MELLDHVVMLFLIFEGLPYSFSQKLHHSAFPETTHKGASLSTSLTACMLLYSVSLFNNHLNECDVSSYCGFALHFPNHK